MLEQNSDVEYNPFSDEDSSSSSSSSSASHPKPSAKSSKPASQSGEMEAMEMQRKIIEAKRLGERQERKKLKMYEGQSTLDRQAQETYLIEHFEEIFLQVCDEMESEGDDVKI